MNSKRKTSGRIRKARATYLGLIAGAATLGAGAVHAIPPGQKDVDTNLAIANSTSFVLIPTSSVTVNNGAPARNCIIQFSAETFITPGDAMDLGYAVDSTSASACSSDEGPQTVQFGNPQPFVTATSVMHVKNIPPGIHTIKPCFRAKDLNFGGGSVGAEATLGPRALTVQCKTQ
jgi:hypothetical protein